MSFEFQSTYQFVRDLHPVALGLGDVLRGIGDDAPHVVPLLYPRGDVLLEFPLLLRGQSLAPEVALQL